MATIVDKDGRQVAVDKDGNVLVKTLVLINGRKYVTNAYGEIVKAAFATTKDGKKFYAKKNGVIVVYKAFRVGGKQYVANKNGVIVKNRWITIGKTRYFCNKRGVVIQTKPVKKK